MTRLFRDGRTETVRSCSIESSLWVQAMEDPSISVRYIQSIEDNPMFNCRKPNELNFFVSHVIIINNNIEMQ